MNKLETLAKKYIRKINDKLFVLEAISSNDLESFNDEVILYKDYVVKNNIDLSINDLALVRTISPNNFPTNLVERTLQEQGVKGTFNSPFTDFIESLKYGEFFANVDVGCSRDEIDVEETKLSYPVYRDTKHFSLNGLASDIFYDFGKVKNKFTDRELIIIEPFVDHLDDELISLNPVDTFYNVNNKPFIIGKNGVFIIDSNTYKKLILNLEIRKDLSKVDVFLYSTKNIKLLSNRFNAQTYMVDIILSFLGYTPMHSIDQAKLYSDIYIGKDYWVSDEEYIKKFQDLIEDLNQKLLGKSYYNIPSEIKKNRKAEYADLYGIFHAETKFFEEEVKNNLNTQINTVKRYLDYLEEKLELNPDLSSKLFDLYSDNLRKYNYSSYRARFYPLDLENEIVSFITKVSYKKIIEVTKDFNNIPVDIKDSIKMK